MSAAGIKVGQAYIGVDVDMSGAKAAVRRGMESAVSGLADIGKKAGLALSAGLAATGGLTLKVGIENIAQIEQAQVGFETMLGSAERAKAFIDDIQQFAIKTPFNANDLVASSQKLLAMGFAAENVLPTLRSIGDASAGLGKGSEGVDRMVTALGQMSAKTKVQTEEVMQLLELGVPAWDILAKAAGKSVAEIQDMASKGQLSAAVAIPQLLAGMDAQFGGLMDKQADTLKGKWDTLTESLQQAAGRAVAPLAPTIKASIDKATGSLDALDDWLTHRWPQLVASITADPAGTLANLAQQLKDSVSQGLQRVTDSVSSFDFGGLADQVKTVFVRLGDHIDIDAISQRLSDGKTAIVDAVLGWADDAKAAVAGIDWSAIWDGVTTTADGATTLVTRWLGDTATMATRVADWLADSIGEIDLASVDGSKLGQWLSDSIVGASEQVGQSILDVVDHIDLTAFSNLGARMMGSIKDGLGVGGEVLAGIDFSAMAQSIGDNLSAAWSNLDLSGNIIEMVSRWFDTVSDVAFWIDLGRNIGDAALSLADGAGSLWDSAIDMLTQIEIGPILAKLLSSLAALVAGLVAAIIAAAPNILAGILSLGRQLVAGAASLFVWLVAETGKFIATFFADTLAFLVKNWASIVDWLTGLPGQIIQSIQQLFDRMRSAIQQYGANIWDTLTTGFKSAFNTILEWWNRLEFKVPAIEIAGVKLSDGFTIGLPDIPLLGDGGHITHPTLAMVGERGPEIVSPQGAIRQEVMAALAAQPASKTIVVHQHFAGHYIMPQHVEHAARKALYATQ